MERLTMRNDAGIAFWADTRCAGGGYRLEGRKEQERLDHLAAYEDAMPLERAQELAQAEKDGRLVVLPCKPGQTIWGESFIRGMAAHFEAPDIEWIIENTERFGTEIFLTREEAEAALKKGEDTE